MKTNEPSCEPICEPTNERMKTIEPSHEPIRKPTNERMKTNEPSREPIREPTKRLGQDALLPVNLSSKCGLCHDKNSERVIFSNQGQDNEIQSDITDSSNTQPSNWQGPKQRSTSPKKVSCSVCALLACEPVTLSKKVASVFHCWRVSPLLHQQKIHPTSSHCWRVSPSLSQQEFHATPSHCWCVRP